MTNTEVLNMEPEKLIEWLSKTFKTEVPPCIETYEDMENSSKLLLRITSSLSYLTELLAISKRNVRICKRECSKQEYEDAMDRREMIQAMVSILEQNYKGISRAVSIKIENNKELHMSDKHI